MLWESLHCKEHDLEGKNVRKSSEIALDLVEIDDKFDYTEIKKFCSTEFSIKRGEKQIGVREENCTTFNG